MTEAGPADGAAGRTGDRGPGDDAGRTGDDGAALDRRYAEELRRVARGRPTASSTDDASDPLAAVLDFLSVDEPPPDPVGTVGPYRIHEALGRGAGGTVYRAVHPELDRVVALKVMPAPPGREDAGRRFEREARALARLEHPHIVPVHDAGRDGSHVWLAMKHMSGRTLADAGPMAPLDTAAVVRDLAQAAQYAHDQGVLHRDIKPTNVLLGGDGRPCLADFGLARLTEEPDASLTRTAVGTPRYMAPEQAAGSPSSPAADVYSLGAVLLELVAGEPPFADADAREIHRRLVRGSSPPERSRRPAGVSRDLWAVMRRATEPRPRLRYRTPEQLADDLERVLEDRPPRARPLSRLGPLAVVGAIPYALRRHPRVTAAAILLAAVAALAWSARDPVDHDLWQTRLRDARTDGAERTPAWAGEAEGTPYAGAMHLLAADHAGAADGPRAARRHLVRAALLGDRTEFTTAGARLLVIGAPAALASGRSEEALTAARRLAGLHFTGAEGPEAQAATQEVLHAYLNLLAWDGPDSAHREQAWGLVRAASLEDGRPLPGSSFALKWLTLWTEGTDVPLPSPPAALRAVPRPGAVAEDVAVLCRDGVLRRVRRRGSQVQVLSTPLLARLPAGSRAWLLRGDVDDDGAAELLAVADTGGAVHWATVRERPSGERDEVVATGSLTRGDLPPADLTDLVLCQADDAAGIELVGASGSGDGRLLVWRPTESADTLEPIRTIAIAERAVRPTSLRVMRRNEGGGLGVLCEDAAGCTAFHVLPEDGPDRPGSPWRVRVEQALPGAGAACFLDDELMTAWAGAATDPAPGDGTDPRPAVLRGPALDDDRLFNNIYFAPVCGIPVQAVGGHADHVLLPEVGSRWLLELEVAGRRFWCHGSPRMRHARDFMVWPAPPDAVPGVRAATVRWRRGPSEHLVLPVAGGVRIHGLDGAMTRRGTWRPPPAPPAPDDGATLTPDDGEALLRRGAWLAEWGAGDLAADILQDWLGPAAVPHADAWRASAWVSPAPTTHGR